MHQGLLYFAMWEMFCLGILLTLGGSIMLFCRTVEQVQEIIALIRAKRAQARAEEEK